MSNDVAPSEQHPAAPVIDVAALPRTAFAPLWRRFLAFFLDSAVVVPTALLVAWPLGTLPFVFDRGAESVGLFGLSPAVAKLVTNLLVIWLYDIYFVGTLRAYGYSIGMYFLNVAVVDARGAKPDASTARRRYWWAGVAALPLGLGLLAILWHPQRRGWHDRRCGTWAMRLGVLKLHHQIAGAQTKFEPPITGGSLLFLPGMVLAAGIIVGTGCILVAVVWLLRPFLKRRA